MSDKPTFPNASGAGETKTPMTDKFERVYNTPPFHKNPPSEIWKFMRQLERELSALHQQNAGLKKQQEYDNECITRFQNKGMELEVKNAELKLRSDTFESAATRALKERDGLVKQNAELVARLEKATLDFTERHNLLVDRVDAMSLERDKLRATLAKVGAIATYLEYAPKINRAEIMKISRLVGESK